MKSILKKFLLGLLICSMLLCAVACGSDTSDTSGTTGTTDTSGTSGTSGTTQTTEATRSSSQNDPDVTPDPDPLPDVEMLPEQEVRVAGINIYAGQNDLAVRSALLAELLNPLNLDSFGVSECRGKWEEYLEQHFGDRYARVGLDCNGKHNATNFATYIYYLKDKYVAIDTGTFWMSKTPDVPSKYGSTVDMNRTCTWVILENIETGFRYVHMNCHLDHMDVAVNKIQCQMIGEQIKRFEAMGYPVFATGDYNMREYNESYPTMTSYANDARYIATKTTDMLTHPESGTIDYCFVTKNTTEVFEFDVLETQTEPIEISDHRGVYVHAKVKPLPKQDPYANSIPSFADGVKLDVIASGSTSCTIRVEQARDVFGSAPRFYQLEVLDRNGKVLSSEQISCGYHLPQQPQTITHALIFPTEHEQYRIRLTPLGLFGQRGEPLVQWVTCNWEVPKPSEPIAPGAADVIDVQAKDGKVKDVSQNAHPLEALGTVTVSGESFSFSNNGNFKYTDFKNYYSTLADGFSAVINIRTGADINTQQVVLANLHAGGFGLQINSGKLIFLVHLNGAYVQATADIEANTDYHIVGVYDPTLGILIYVNGELVSMVAVAENASFGTPTDKGAEYLCIGADSNAAGNGEYFFKGSITQAAIYSDVISYANVLYLYQNQQ